jgi:hypothetical protein
MDLETSQNGTSFLLQSAVDSVKFNVNKNKRNSQNSCEKVKFVKDFNWLGKIFKISISKILVFLLYVDKFVRVLTT